MINIVVSFLIAILMGMGIGGGGFLVIYLTLCLNYGQILAQGTNLIFFLICGLSAVFIHLFKRKISLKQVVIMSIFGSFGAWIFSQIANTVSPEIPKITLGVFLIISGAVSIIKAIRSKEE